MRPGKHCSDMAYDDVPPLRIQTSPNGHSSLALHARLKPLTTTCHMDREHQPPIPQPHRSDLLAAITRKRASSQNLITGMLINAPDAYQPALTHLHDPHSQLRPIHRHGTLVPGPSPPNAAARAGAHLVVRAAGQEMFSACGHLGARDLRRHPWMVVLPRNDSHAGSEK